MKKIHETTGSLPELISPYLRKLIDKTGGVNGPIGLQFHLLSPADVCIEKNDPLAEEENEVAPGVVYKYQGKLRTDGSVLFYGRALWLISRYCASYCRFCTRGRVVGLPADKSQERGETLAQKPYLDEMDIQKALSYFKNHQEINEVILSGGDPFVTSRKYLEQILESLITLQKQRDLTIIRIHTRVPITNPFFLQDWHYALLARIPHLYLVLHINHPAELTEEVQAIIKKLKNTGATLLSQSVLLKGVNDSPDTLHDLFVQVVTNGIHPYYLHYTDPVPWAKRFTVPLPRAIKLWQTVRPRLSGIAATARFVIDTPHHGKIPIADTTEK
ncbi:radical SAM protein [Candidatus Roizmanbacteria bacterium]|nr:radical SAM protein [Candidatus Roizmanbacteria bacterium]